MDIFREEEVDWSLYDHYVSQMANDPYINHVIRRVIVAGGVGIDHYDDIDWTEEMRKHTKEKYPEANPLIVDQALAVSEYFCRRELKGGQA